MNFLKTMRRGIRLSGWVIVGLLATGISAGSDSDKTNAALKQVSKATKGLRGLVAEVEFIETVGERTIDGSGKIYVHFGGGLRAEIGGDEPRTVLFTPPYLYIHRKAEQLVEIYDVTSNPHRLGQYIMLGFVPAGKALKERFNVQLIENSTLDGRPVLNFLITPNAKKHKDAARAIARIQLWVDPESGLPLQHQIVHASGEVRLDVRYLSMSVDDTLPDTLFRPKWPEGTATHMN